MKDLYWLAGLIEGEGCFSWKHRRKGNAYPLINLKMNDLDIVQRAHKIFGCGCISKGGNNYGMSKDSHQLQIVGQAAIDWMVCLYPMMGKRRKIRILEVFNESKFRGMRRP